MAEVAKDETKTFRVLRFASRGYRSMDEAGRVEPYSSDGQSSGREGILRSQRSPKKKRPTSTAVHHHDLDFRSGYASAGSGGRGRRSLARQTSDREAESDLEGLDYENFRSLFRIEYRSHLSAIFENLEDRKRWERFISFKEEEQRRLLKALEPTRYRHDPTKIDPNASATRFSRTDRRIRLLLRRQYDSPFISEFETQIAEFVAKSPEETEGALVMHDMDGYRRALCHGICQYWGITSYSVDKSGERVFVAERPKSNPFAPPCELLAAYLVRTHSESHPEEDNCPNLDSNTTTTIRNNRRVVKKKPAKKPTK